MKPFQIPKAVQRLLDAGILPPNCRKAVLTLEPNAVITLDLTVFVTSEQLSAITDALVNDPETVKGMARKIAFTDGENTTESIDLEGVGAAACL